VGGLVAYWPLDEGSGNIAYDQMAQHDNFELYPSASPPTWTACPFGTCLTFNGTSQYASSAIPLASLTPTSTYTVTMWFQWTSKNGQEWNDLFSDPNTSIASGVWDGQLSFGGEFASPCCYYGVSTAASSNYVDSQWHFLAASYDGQNLALYVDGALQGTYSFASPNPFVIGSEGPLLATANGSSGFFGGSLSHVRIYNYALSAVSVSALYNARE
jgi:hypothetical protein